MSDLELTVRGGAGSIDATYLDLERLGRLHGDLGDRLLQHAWDDRRTALDADLMASGLLSPVTCAEAESAILAATYGPRGLAVRAASVEAQSYCFVAVVELYRSADEAQGEAIGALQYGLGFVVGVHLPGLLVTGAVVHGSLHLTGGEGLDTATLVEEHPEMLEAMIGGGGGLLDGLHAGPLTGPVMALLGIAAFHPDTGAAAEDLGALLFGDYAGSLGDHPGDDFAHLAAPEDVQDLVDALGETAAPEVPDGVLNIQRITDADGSVRYVVQLPGTDRFFDEGTVRNMGSNLALIAGDSTAYGEAVGLAMAAAGVPPDAPVMLVGHSQGGMQAAALAGDPDFGYHVTHVLTAGSPVAIADIPADVTVLSLENTGDLVPLLDGAPNPAAAHHVTVQADLHAGHLGAADGQNHSLTTYSELAGAVDASADPSVEAVVESMRELGYLGADPGRESTSWSFRAEQGEQLRGPGNPLLAEILDDLLP